MWIRSCGCEGSARGREDAGRAEVQRRLRARWSEAAARRRARRRRRSTSPPLFAPLRTDGTEREGRQSACLSTAAVAGAVEGGCCCCRREVRWPAEGLEADAPRREGAGAGEDESIERGNTRAGPHSPSAQRQVIHIEHSHSDFEFRIFFYKCEIWLAHLFPRESRNISISRIRYYFRLSFEITLHSFLWPLLSSLSVISFTSPHREYSFQRSHFYVRPEFKSALTIRSRYSHFSES